MDSVVGLTQKTQRVNRAAREVVYGGVGLIHVGGVGTVHRLGDVEHYSHSDEPSL